MGVLRFDRSVSNANFKKYYSFDKDTLHQVVIPFGYRVHYVLKRMLLWVHYVSVGSLADSQRTDRTHGTEDREPGGHTGHQRRL